MTKPRHHLTIIGMTRVRGLTKPQIIGTKEEIATDLRSLANAIDGGLHGNTIGTLGFGLAKANEELLDRDRVFNWGLRECQIGTH